MLCELHNNDAIETMRRQPTASVDALITDPPYGTTNISWDKPINWPAFWREAGRICKPSAIVVMFSAQPFTIDLINTNRKQFRYELIWEKTRATGFLNANRRPLTCHENILIFAGKLHSTVYNPQKTPGKPYKGSTGGATKHYSPKTMKIGNDNPTGDRHPKSVLRFASENKPGQHPTQKPLDMMEFLVRSYSNPGQVVCDPFFGSGSTTEAALQDGRRFVGSETDETYFFKTYNRIDALLRVQ